MTTQRAAETTGEQAHGLASPAPATTYQEPQDRYRPTTGARERVQELTTGPTVRAETAAGTRAGTGAQRPGQPPRSASGAAVPPGTRPACARPHSPRAGMEAHP